MKFWKRRLWADPAPVPPWEWRSALHWEIVPQATYDRIKEQIVAKQQ
jgi:hypothetical protein